MWTLITGQLPSGRRSRYAPIPDYVRNVLMNPNILPANGPPVFVHDVPSGERVVFQRPIDRLTEAMGSYTVGNISAMQ
jgi:hypothetical protein